MYLEKVDALYIYRGMAEKGFTPRIYFEMVSEQNSCLKN